MRRGLLLGSGACGVALLAYGQLWSAQTWVMEDRASIWMARHMPSVFAPRGLSAATWFWTQTPMMAHGFSVMCLVLVAGLAATLTWRLSQSAVASMVVGFGLLAHPFFVETVAYASSRTELLAALWVLAACVVATLAPDMGRVGLMALCLVCAVWSKESALVGGALVALIGVWQRRSRGWLWLAGPAVCGIAALWHYGGVSGLVNREVFARDIGAVDWALMQMTATVRLLGVFVLGVGMTPDYDYDRVPLLLRGLSAGIVLLLMMIAWRQRDRRTLIVFGLTWSLIALSPRWVIQTPRSYLNEHQAFLPAIGWLMALGGTVEACARAIARGATWGRLVTGVSR